MADRMIDRRLLYGSILTGLKRERFTFEPQWKDIAEVIAPTRTQFFINDRNKGDRRNLKILDTTGTQALRDFTAGMASGVSSQARPWFLLTTDDPDLANFGPVKEWLHKVSEILRLLLIRTNIYQTFPKTYSAMGAFATGAFFIEEDMNTLFHTRDLPIGSYWIGVDAKGKPDIYGREFQMNVRQVVHVFGTDSGRLSEIDWTKISITVRRAYEKGEYETRVHISHLVLPNPKYNRFLPFSTNKRWADVYWETGIVGSQIDHMASAEFDKLLREGGFDRFPVMAGRWETSGEDAYGTNCPGMISLGDVRQLQTVEKRLLQGLEKSVFPTLKGPPELRRSKVSLLAGDVTHVVEQQGQKGLTPIHEVKVGLNDGENKQAQTRARIKEAFYVDLFRLFADIDRRQITAREIDEKSGEKLTMLASPLESVNIDVLGPTVDHTYDFASRQRRLPPPPEDLIGQDLSVRFVSILAQAQKAQGIGAMDRYLGSVLDVFGKTGDSAILDTVNWDRSSEIYADLTGVDPTIHNTREKIEVIRTQRAEAAQAQAQLAMVKEGAAAAKDLSQADVSNEDSALGRMTKNAEGGQ